MIAEQPLVRQREAVRRLGDRRSACRAARRPRSSARSARSAPAAAPASRAASAARRSSMRHGAARRDHRSLGRGTPASRQTPGIVARTDERLLLVAGPSRRSCSRMRAAGRRRAPRTRRCSAPVEHVARARASGRSSSAISLISLQLPDEPAVVAIHPAVLERALDRREQLVDVERLLARTRTPAARTTAIADASDVVPDMTTISASGARSLIRRIDVEARVASRAPRSTSATSNDCRLERGRALRRATPRRCAR